MPDLEKIIGVAKYFDVSLDALLMGNDQRIVEEMNRAETLKPQYQNIHDWEFYSSNLMTEFEQSTEGAFKKYKIKTNSVESTRARVTVGYTNPIFGGKFSPSVRQPPCQYSYITCVGFLPTTKIL